MGTPTSKEAQVSHQANGSDPYLGCLGVERLVMHVLVDRLREARKPVTMEQIITACHQEVTERGQQPLSDKQLGKKIDTLVPRRWLRRIEDGQLIPTKQGLRAYGEDISGRERVLSPMDKERSLTDSVKYLFDLLLEVREGRRFKFDPRVNVHGEILEVDLRRWASASHFTREAYEKAVAILVRLGHVIATPIGGALLQYDVGTLLRAAPDVADGAAAANGASLPCNSAVIAAEDCRDRYEERCYREVLLSFLAQAEATLRARVDRIPNRHYRREADSRNQEENWPSAGVPMGDVISFLRRIFPNEPTRDKYGPLSHSTFARLEEVTPKNLWEATGNFLGASLLTQYSFCDILVKALLDETAYFSDARNDGRQRTLSWWGPVIRARTDRGPPLESKRQSNRRTGGETAQADGDEALIVDQALPVQVAVNGLPNRARTAYLQYEETKKEMGTGNPTDEQVYNQHLEKLKLTGEHSDLPSCEAWTRNLREARRRLGVQKNEPRRGRKSNGGSVVRQDEV